MLSTKDNAAETFFRTATDDMNVLFKASKIIRSELLNHTKWKFSGSLNSFDVSSPLKLFVKWVIAGLRENIAPERKIEEIKTTTNSTIQMLIGAVKTNDQVPTRKSDDDENYQRFRLLQYQRDS